MAFNLITTCIFLLFLKDIKTDTKNYYETNYVDVPLDHFTPSPDPKTFKLRYLLNTKYHVKGGPVLLYTGGRENISVSVENVGFLFEMAPVLNALLVFIEHRYYGESLPFGNGTFKSIENLRYLTTTQTLADFALVVNNIKTKFFKNVITEDTLPFIAFGGSYGGMLAAWLRMKYPYLVLGAVSSSAPIWYFPGLTNCDCLYKKTTEIFLKYGSEKCVEMIRNSWESIIKSMKNKLGMDFISNKFKLCKKINNKEDIKRFLEWLEDIYVNLATFNYQYPTNYYVHLPSDPVKVFCNKLTFYNNTEAIIEHLSRAIEIYTNYTGNKICNNINYTLEDTSLYAYDYQSCTELIKPKCSTTDDMFINNNWDYKKHAEDCFKKFNVRSLGSDWGVMVYGGKNLRYFSNIVFVNNMMDPWVCGCVTNKGSGSVMVVNISDSTHQVDLRKSDPVDNNYITEARKHIIQVIKMWL